MLCNNLKLKPPFLDTISTILGILRNCSDYGINLVRDMEEGLVNSGLFSHDPSKTNPGVVMMESSLLDIGSNPEVSQGIDFTCCLLNMKENYLSGKK